MNRVLNDIEIEYVLHHLAFHVKGFQRIRPFLRFGERQDSTPSVLMPLSDLAFSPQSLIWIEEGVPVLFPLSETSNIWSVSGGGDLVFYHDLLKSAFYLLSGRAEWEQADKQDSFGRFDYDFSIQKQLNIIDKPVVNYYFSLIADGLIAFGGLHGIVLEKRRPFGQAGLMITHDVDRIDYYSWRSVVFRGLQWMGLKPREIDGKVHLAMAVDAFRKMMRPSSKRKDPFWSFDFFREVERSQGFSSTWYFLNRDGSPDDAPYRLEEKRLREMTDRLRMEGCEVGLHGSFKASEEADKLKFAVIHFKRCFGYTPLGTRQHFLKGHLPELYHNELAAGLKYDAGLGFAAREGFRNSYCWPFKPFDHDRQAMIPFYVIPMAWMDTSLFEHRKLKLEEVLQVSDKLMNEVIKFNGLFNVLWHSCRTNEWLQPGIKKVYRQLCESWARPGVEPMTGAEAWMLIDRNGL
jgi:hypothetical protein